MLMETAELQQLQQNMTRTDILMVNNSNNNNNQMKSNQNFISRAYVRKSLIR